MKPIKIARGHEHMKHVPLWKWLVIILLVLAMPLFFSFYRNVQIQQALMQTNPVSTPNMNK